MVDENTAEQVEQETPDTPDTSPSESTEGSDYNEFDELLDTQFDDDDDAFTTAEPAPAQEPAPEEASAEGTQTTEEAEGSAPKKEEPTTAETTPAEPEAPAPTDAQATTQGEQPSPESQLSKEQLAEAYTTRRAEMVGQLAQHYALTDEQVEAIDTDPKTAFAELAARVHMEVLEAAVLNTARMLPSMIRNVQTVQTSVAGNEERFFTQWPQLRDHAQTVTKLGRAFRDANPDATAEDFITNVGAMAMVALKIPVEEQAQASAPAATPAPKPFKSAAGGLGPTKQVETNIFAQLDEMIEREM